MLKILFRNNKFLLLVVAFYSFVTMTPIMGFFIPPIGYVAIFMFVVLYYIMSNNRMLQYEWRRIITFSTIYICIVLAYWIFGISSASSGNYFNEFRFLLPILLTVLVLQKCDIPQQSAIVFFVSTIIAFNFLDSIRICFLHPEMVSYQQLSAEMHESLNIGVNLGSASFQTMAIFYLYIQLLASHFSDRKALKYTYILYACISLFFIVFCTYKATVVIFSLFAIALFYISKKVQNKHAAILILSIFLIIYILFGDYFIELVVNIIDSQRIADRLLIFTSGGNTEDSVLTGRTNLYLLSIQTWLSNIVNFLFGIGDQRSSYNAVETGISQHSEFADALAKYGLIGAMIIWKIFHNLFSMVKSKFQNQDMFFIYSFFALIIICGCTKKIFFPDCGLLILFLFPLVINMQNTDNYIIE